ncbi:MAG: type II toxin-antitoxin system RelE/ParE family toxin [Wenzhouxiangella sp.]|nr:type II toxin-antitoxin system RelE/ParE family toxin [Wenzhouxiangella sp.]
MKSIRILGAARRDLIQGYWFYEQQTVGIGRYFLDTLYSEIESLSINAGIHPVKFRDYHQLLSRRFPWSVYYKDQGNKIAVHAVLDNRAYPAVTEKRLKVQEL